MKCNFLRQINKKSKNPCPEYLVRYSIDGNIIIFDSEDYTNALTDRLIKVASDYLIEYNAGKIVKIFSGPAYDKYFLLDRGHYPIGKKNIVVFLTDENFVCLGAY